MLRMKQAIRPGSQLYPKVCQVSAVNDPLKLGRVKVLYGDDEPIESEWIYTLGLSSGLVSTQFIGVKGIAIFLNGNHEDAVFLGIMPSNSGHNTHGSPMSLPIIDTRGNTQIPVCDDSMMGQIALFSDTESIDLKVCIRNNVLSNKDGDEIENKYFWKSLTHSLVISKGQYGESNKVDNLVPDTRTNTLWHTCEEQFQGEKRLLAEDRSLSQGEYICRKQPGNLWGWVPTSSPPLYTKENLPRCTARILGSMVAIDDGKNTELIMCGRKDSTASKDNLVWIKFVRSFLMGHNGVTQMGVDITKNDDAVPAQDHYLEEQQINNKQDQIKTALWKIFSDIDNVASAINNPSAENVIKQITDLEIFK